VKCIYVCCCPRRFPYHMIVVSFDNNTSGVASGTGTANLSEHRFSVHGIRIVHSLVFCVALCRSLPFCPISLCHCIVYPSSTCNSNNLFGTVKLFDDYLSRIDLWDEMWITSTRMVIRWKLLIKSDRMDLYCIRKKSL